MKKAIKRIAMLFMVCGLAVSVSFGAAGYGNIDMLKAEIEEFEAYRLNLYSGDRDRAKIDCEGISPSEDFSLSLRFYCEAKVALLLLEEAKAKKNRLL